VTPSMADTRSRRETSVPFTVDEIRQAVRLIGTHTRRALTLPLPFSLEPEQRDARPGLRLFRATAITFAFAAAGTALFSMLIALSHAMQGKDTSLSRTLLIAAPACALLSLLGVPASAHARRANPERVGTPRALLTNAAAALLFASAFTVLRALVGLTRGSHTLVEEVERQFTRGFGVAVLIYCTLMLATWMLDRHRRPSALAVTGDDAHDNSSPTDSSSGDAPTSFVVRTGARTYVVPLERVDWIEAQGNYVSLHAGGRSHLVRHTMKSLAASLEGTFVRVERSAMVRVSAIREIRTTAAGSLVILHDGSELKLSRRMRAAVIEAMAAMS
jgi:DNA-binding LytR/AlgR family response regulator